MDPESIDRILDEIFPNFEPLDAQSAALLQLLKAKGLVTDEELAPFLKQASDAAGVRWLAVRVRVEALIANLLSPPENSSATSTEKNPEDAAENEQPENQEKNSRASQAKQGANQAEQKDESEPELPSNETKSSTSETNEAANDKVENAA